MIKEFIPYEQALDLKELGFEEECFDRFYTKPKCKMFGIDEHGRPYSIKNTPKTLYTIGDHAALKESNVILAPLYQQAFRWFREKHTLIGHVRESWSFDNTMEYVAQINGTFVNHGLFDKPVNRFDTYEEAELACLKKLIEIVKTK